MTLILILILLALPLLLLLHPPLNLLLFLQAAFNEHLANAFSTNLPLYKLLVLRPCALNEIGGDLPDVLGVLARGLRLASHQSQLTLVNVGILVAIAVYAAVIVRYVFLLAGCRLLMQKVI